MNQLRTNQSENQGGPTEDKADTAHKDHRWWPLGKDSMKYSSDQKNKEKQRTVRTHFRI